MRKDEIIIDSFAGGGGASTGIFMALGVSPHIAINHDAAAINMHRHNHPETVHYQEDIYEIDMVKVVAGRKVGLLWASPSCTHHSRARGSMPVTEQLRGQGMKIVDWAEEVSPRVIVVENVREWQDWSPVTDQLQCNRCDWKGADSQAKLYRKRQACPRCNSVRVVSTGEYVPDPDRKGETFREWVAGLTRLGYDVQWRDLNASDYGSPTHRRRLFVVARRDGKPIRWPKPTHTAPEKAKGRLKPWRTAAENIDWSIPCKSIFERERPLKEATMRRIALGVKRYVLDSQKPFLVRCNHGGDHWRGQTADQPMCTLTQYQSSAVVSPTIVPLTHSGERRPPAAAEPLPTITTAKRGELAVATPKAELLNAWVIKHFGGQVGVGVVTPLPTTTQRGTQNQLATVRLTELQAKSSGNMGNAERTAAFLVKYFGTAIAKPVDAPIGTLTAKDRYALVTVEIEGQTYVIVDIGMRMLTPRELADCQGFPHDYWLPPTKTHAVAKIGNSVCPQAAAAVVSANMKPLRRSKKGQQRENQVEAGAAPAPTAGS